MTTESTVHVGLGEIGIRLECRACHSKLTVPLAKTIRTPIVCGYCNEQWLQGQNDSRFQMLNGFLINLKALRELTDLPFYLTIELPDSRASDASSRDSA